jgi:nucleotide-binding universal stress UspA family protein
MSKSIASDRKVDFMCLYSELAIPITGAAGDDEALDVAICLALQFNARIRMLTIADRISFLDGECPRRNHAHRSPATYIERLRARLGNTPVLSEVIEIEATESSDPAVVVAERARFADMSVVSAEIADASKGGPGRDYFGNLLLESGRPVLVVPACGRTKLPFRRMVFAWRSAAVSARALHDAMPLLTRADHVDVIAIDVAESVRSAHDSWMIDLEACLARHNITAAIQVQRSQGHGIAASLVEHAQRVDAQLIVAGGFGHARLGGWAGGGVTCDLLRSTSVPVLFSH